MKYLPFCFLLLLASCVYADDDSHIAINNRVLTQVNGKAITVMDVTKKMDMLLLRNQPQEALKAQFRLNFYRTNWRNVLLEMVDRELVLQAAEDFGIPISTGDVRQELETIFGPNVLVNLEKMGLSWDEAWSSIRNEIITRRMLMWQVSSRVEAEVTPQEVRTAYDSYLRGLKGGRQYSYRMITFRGENGDATLARAREAHELLTKQNLPIDQLKEKFPGCSISDVFTQQHDEIAASIREILAPLAPASFSEPQLQKTRSETNPVARIYFLHEKQESSPKSFAEMESSLRDELLNERYANASQKYFSNLRKQYNVKPEEIAKDLPKDFEPYMTQ
jgi:hypothetical protein